VLLSSCVLDHNHGAVDGVTGLVRLATCLAKYLNARQRREIALAMLCELSDLDLDVLVKTRQAFDEIDPAFRACLQD
jgi:hypothetical protein